MPFKDLNRIQGLCKTTIKIQDLFKIVDNRAPEAPLHSFPMKLTLHANVLNFSDNLNTIYGLSVLSLENLRKLGVIGA